MVQWLRRGGTAAGRLRVQAALHWRGVKDGGGHGMVSRCGGADVREVMKGG